MYPLWMSELPAFLLYLFIYLFDLILFIFSLFLFIAFFSLALYHNFAHRKKL